MKAGEIEGCLNATFGQYPDTLFVPSCTGDLEGITNNEGITGEFSMVTVINGNSYTFSSSNETTFITIGNEDGTTVLASGVGSVTWISSVTGNVRFITHLNSECESNFDTIERFVKCGEAEEIWNCEDNVVSVDNLEDYFLLGGDTNQKLAIDVKVPAEGYTLYGIIPVLAGNTSNFSFKIYDDNNGVPGNEVEVRNGIIASQESLFDEYIQYSLAFDTPIELEGGNTYWIEILTNANGWAFTSNGESVINNNSAGNNDQTGGTWQSMTGFELVYSLACDELLGISDVSSFDFSYYPNPVNDVLNLKTQKEIKLVSVFNLTGQEVMTTSRIINKKMNVSALSAGVYIFKVVLENGQIETFKIMKR